MSAAEAVLAGSARGTAPSRRPASALVAGARFLRSELLLIGGRRRNQAGLAVLALVPIIIGVAAKMTASSSGGVLDNFTSNGLLVAFAALQVEVAMFLPLAIAMISGDAIAGEANQGTLRYLLTVPVGRTRLLVVKYLSLCFGAFWGVLTVAVPGAVIGLVLFGAGRMTTLSGSQISAGQAWWRLILVCLYLSAGLAALAAVGLFVSTLTEQPIAAAITVMIFNIVSWILDNVAQLDWLHPWLLVHRWLAFGDLLREPMFTDDVVKGLLVDAGYALVFWLAAWARFGTKDITS